MTCIVAIKTDKEIWLGGDSAAIDANSLAIDRNPHHKVFKNKDILMGYSGSFRIGQLLEFDFNPPINSKNLEPMAYMCKVFVPALNKCLEQHHLSLSANNKEIDNEFLVAYSGRLFQVATDLHIKESATGYDSIGIGAPLALGSLYTSNGFDLEPIQRMELALKAATEYNAGVLPPYYYKNIKHKKGKI